MCLTNTVEQLKNKALSVITKHLGEAKTLLDHQVMDILVEGITNEDISTQYEFAVYTNLFIEFKKQSYARYVELQYHFTDDIGLKTACLDMLKRMPHKTEEMVRLMDLIIYL